MRPASTVPPGLSDSRNLSHQKITPVDSQLRHQNVHSLRIYLTAISQAYLCRSRQPAQDSPRESRPRSFLCILRPYLFHRRIRIAATAKPRVVTPPRPVADGFQALAKYKLPGRPTGESYCSSRLLAANMPGSPISRLGRENLQAPDRGSLQSTPVLFLSSGESCVEHHLSD